MCPRSLIFSHSAGTLGKIDAAWLSSADGQAGPVKRHPAGAEGMTCGLMCRHDSCVESVEGEGESPGWWILEFQKALINPYFGEGKSLESGKEQGGPLAQCLLAHEFPTPKKTRAEQL